MARKATKSGKRARHKTRAPRRRIKITPLRILIALALVIALVWGGGAWLAQRWTPARGLYPVQGVTASAASESIIWPTARAAGVDFAYLLATIGADGRDPSFADHLDHARGAGLRYGAVHRYSLCASATAQATRFIATVPRDPQMLPPAIALGFWPDCAARPSRDKLIAELTTFLSQIEAHGGKPALLRLSRPFEADYRISEAVGRALWLEGDFFAPGYAARPWVMWTASTWKRVPGIEGAVEWTVVRP